ncbi:MAG: D-ornithine---citrate ligase [Micromonosporaceae bacterium]|nr:D-ornithine---citrate ligase [Micromonosporaceae bacterium]
MTALTAIGPTALAATAAESALGDAAPHLVAGFRENLPRAADVVDRRLVAAAYREGLAGEHSAWADGRTFLSARDGGYLVTRARRHAFDRIEIQERLAADPAVLLRRLAGSGDGGVATELTDATVNLALAYARRARISEQLVAQALETGALDSLDLAAGLDSDEQCVFFERLSTEGHNLHPCGRTRIGWTVADLLAHDLESPTTAVGFVGVRRSIHIGDDVGGRLLPDLSIDHGRYAVTPVHAWQLDRVVRGRYADLVADGTLVPLDITIPATPTAALRTLMLPADPDGTRRYLKASLDIQVTSTRRTISVASTRNGPVLSALLASLLDTDRVVLMAETAGSATVASGGRERDLAAILRSGLSGRLAANEVAVSGGGLYAISPVTGTTVVTEIVTRFARTRGLTDRAAAALAFVGEYARLLLPPVLTLATRYGVGLEAHLQNCVPTFVNGVPHRLALRDFAGLRLYPPRLPAALRLWPGSVVVTDDADVMRSKVAYTTLQAHLGEIVIRLVESHDLDEAAAWSAVRRVVEEVYEELRADPAVADRAGDDHAFLTAPTLPHKALLTMRLAAGRGHTSDIYVRVENPLR